MNARIVGAGLTGSLLAVFLSKRGIETKISERRRDMRNVVVDRGRSINLAISVRGLHALQKVGLREKVLDLAVPMKGRMMHDRVGKTTFQQYGVDETECIYSISRAELNKILMTEAEARGAQIAFDETIETEEQAFRGTDMVFGADGSGSILRSILSKNSSFEVTQSTLDYGYKELTIPSKNGNFQFEKHALHIWPRGNFMLIALPNSDGSFTCTLFLPFEGQGHSFKTVNSPDQVRSFFSSEFPDAVDKFDDLVGTFFSNPIGQMITVRTSPWYGDRALLIGDAAHAIVPFFGQGMNCGFEDVSVLDELLADQTNETLLSRFFLNRYYLSRKPNTDAIADLAIENFLEMRDKVGNPRFLLEKNVEQILARQFPDKYFSRYRLVTFSRTPYRVAYEAGLIQNQMLEDLCRGLARAEDVDLARAEEKIQQQLWPLLHSYV